MPATKQTSILAGKLGGKLDAAIKNAAGAEINYGFQRLPGGIPNGIAQLAECGFGTVEKGKQNEGKLYFRAMGVVLEPETNDKGIPVKGLQTSIVEMIFDTKGQSGKTVTQAEHISNVVNELRKIAPDCCDGISSAADLEGVCANLVAAAPCFRFSTRESAAVIENGKEKYPARVWERWHGSKGLEDYVPPGTEGAVEDNTAAVTATPPSRPAANGKAPAAKGGGKPPAGKKAPAATPEPEEEEVVEEQPEFNEFDTGDVGAVGATDVAEASLEELVTRADENEKEAQDELGRRAMASGAKKKQIDTANSWQDVADMVKEEEPAAEAEAEEVVEEVTEEEEGEAGPTLEHVYHYHPVDPTTRKAAKEPVEVLIKAVDATKQTADALNMVNKKSLYRGIPWAKLLPI